MYADCRTAENFYLNKNPMAFKLSDFWLFGRIYIFAMREKD